MAVPGTTVKGNIKPVISQRVGTGMLYLRKGPVVRNLHHPPECPSGNRKKLLPATAFVHAKKRLIDKKDFLLLVISDYAYSFGKIIQVKIKLYRFFHGKTSDKRLIGLPTGRFRGFKGFCAFWARKVLRFDRPLGPEGS
jgi:hypothetical protein